MKQEKYSTFKILSHSELDRLYALPIDKLKEELDKINNHLNRNKQVYPKYIEPNRPFYAGNGDFYAILKPADDGQLFIHYYEKVSGNLFTQEGLKPMDIRPVNASIIPEEVDDACGSKHVLNFIYLDEYEHYSEVHQVHYNRTHVLYSADPNCDHEIEPQWSGIKCIHCNGWYCA